MTWADDMADARVEVFETFGAPAIAGSRSGTVVLMAPGRQTLDGIALVRDWSARYRLEEFPDLAHGSAITINDVAFTVREVVEDDEWTATATLTRVA